ncbi:MucBP domain-containing protein, partial [Enterococcus haemoperoxidus]
MKKVIPTLIFLVSMLCIPITDVYADVPEIKRTDLAEELTSNWVIEEYQNHSIPNLTVEDFFKQNVKSPTTLQKMVIMNFANIGESTFTASKSIPMKAGYTYKFNLIYAMYVTAGIASIDFNGELINSNSDTEDHFFIKEIKAVEDSLFTIRIHFDIPFKSNVYIKMATETEGPNVSEELKTEAQVKIHYKDENGNTILPDEELTGVEGSEYTVERKNIEGYVSKAVDGKETGVFTVEVQEITYIYEKKKAQGQVKIHYKDENGNTILPDEELTGVEGSEYTVERKNIEGYVSKA